MDDDALLLMPPEPLDPLRDVAAAVGEALRYPLSGPRLTELATRGGRVTIVVEPRSLPLPGAMIDPRQQAVAAVIDELERLGMPAEAHTILIAGGLERRAGRRELEAVLRPTGARDFRGTVAVHDATSDDLRLLELEGAPPVRIHPTLLDADLVVCVTAAETSERGGACTLLGACAAEDIASPRPGSLAARAVALTDGRARGPGGSRARATDGRHGSLDRARPSAPQPSLPRLPVLPACR